MVPFKSCFMHDPQIPNFYFANLELAPFLDDFDRPVGPQGCVEMFLEFDFRGDTSYKVYPNFDF